MPATGRRAFLARLSAGVAAFGLPGPLPAVDGRRWPDLPALDGALTFDEAARAEAAVDLGGHAVLRPAAVLRPRSATDLVQIVRYANTHGLRVAMRGQGHSQYGQTLVEDGIVIDSRTLAGVAVRGERTVEAHAGATWEEVTRATLAQGLTPPAMGDAMTLSVGGILSAGGVSNSSHLFGGVVDNVEELDVVTGAGELVTCSPRASRDLFDAALAGMGQCGLIARARLRLVEAPRRVVRRDLDYDDLAAFLADHRRLAEERRVEHLGAYVLRREDGPGWRFRINAGRFCDSPEQVAWPAIEEGLRFVGRGDPAVLSFPDYLHREAVRDARLAAAWRATPSRRLYVAVFVPGSASEEFVRGVLASPPETEGMTRFSLYALPTRRFGRPMFVLPDEPVALCVFLFRSVPLGEPARYAEMAAVVRHLAGKAVAASGKAYPPYAPFFRRSDWEAHYGPARWARLVAAKSTYDPKGVLTPGTAMFTG